MLPYLFLSLHLLFAFAVFFLVLAFLTGAPYVPSTNPVAHSMISLARLKKGMTVYDLGSGDGKLLLLAHAQGALAIGIEINPFLVFLSKIRTIRKKVRVYWGSFWNAKLKDADVVFVYLLPWRMEKLANLLEIQCKPGTLIVSNSFVFPNWEIVRKDEKNHVYVFRI